jgi:hypothetical protein
MPKKIFKGLPMFLHLKFFKTALMGDIKQWLNRHRHRRSGFNVKRKMQNVKGKC